ncbi:MAG: hypothetical protein HDT21_13505, partial [Ruminococcus sp.]|nr:hypothetical protein [Ruminococcus sp.]
AVAFLTPFTVPNERDFAACGRRPKGSALWTSASWAQLDQLLSAATPPKCCHTVRGAINQNLPSKIYILVLTNRS